MTIFPLRASCLRGGATCDFEGSTLYRLHWYASPGVRISSETGFAMNDQAPFIIVVIVARARKTKDAQVQHWPCLQRGKMCKNGGTHNFWQFNWKNEWKWWWTSRFTGVLVSIKWRIQVEKIWSSSTLSFLSYKLDLLRGGQQQNWCKPQLQTSARPMPSMPKKSTWPSGVERAGIAFSKAHAQQAIQTLATHKVMSAASSPVGAPRDEEFRVGMPIAPSQAKPSQTQDPNMINIYVRCFRQDMFWV